MRAWLQKPWVTALLALVAGGIIYVNVLRPLFFTPSIMQAEPDADNLSILPMPIASRKEVATPVDWGEVRKAVPKRSQATHDPFRPYVAVLASGTRAVHGRSGTGHLRQKPLQLRAIMIGSTLRHALIGDRVMHVGESIRGLKIVRITEDSVYFAGRGGHVHLRLGSHGKGG